MRFLDDSSDDESISASGDHDENMTGGISRRVRSQNSDALYARRRVIVESDSDSSSESDRSSYSFADNPTSEPVNELSSENHIEIDLAGLSISNTGQQNEDTNGLDSGTSQCSSSSVSLFSDRDPEDASRSPSVGKGGQKDIHHQRESTREEEEAPSASTPGLPSIGGDDLESRDSAWTLDETAEEYFLTGKVDAIKGEVRWPELRVPRDLYDRLYDHQKVGVQWLASLHTDGIGGILGDDMGLGKTFQTLTFLGGLMVSGTIRSALVCCPVSLLRTWEKEARDILEESFGLDVSISVISSDVSKKKRTQLLQSAMNCSTKYPHLAITTYGLVTSNPYDFIRTDQNGEKMAWNYVILDEGHKIKNPSTKTTKGCHRICKHERTRRLLLTGTPVQNNLKELWTLFDWATSSKLLRKLQYFNNRFAQPIEAGRHKNASDSTISIASKANTELQELLRPHFLQRLKSVEFKDELPSKREIVVWTHLSKKQRQLYEDYVENGGNVQSILAGEINSPLVAITWLKKLCGHPLLVSWTEDDWNLLQFDDEGHKTIVRDSAKLKVLVDLLIRLRKSRHRTLVFSQSTKMLDIIEKALCQFSFARIDGSTKERERQRIVDNFNKQGSRYSVLLLSTKAAGLGLTLTGADRCIVYDPSWNPAEDSQAVDRCFRIGQTKKVTVYRFIAAGTVEERMYEKQVFKEGIKRAIMTNNGSSTERYFNKDELRRIFQLAPEGCCEILDKFRGESSKCEFDKNEAEKQNSSFILGASGKPSFLDSHRHVVGLSSHDHLYTSAISKGYGTETGQKTQSTPFAGTSLVKERRVGRAARAMQGKQLDFESAQPGAKVSVLPTNEETHSRGTEIQGAREPLAAITGNKSNMSENFGTRSTVPVQNASRNGDESKDKKELENAMGQLLDSLDEDLMKGPEKLRLHENIVRHAIHLGWL
uniref:Uncharacterized protein n=1 Tax=Odontella aurita TaxID=265563 RepID=A0A7S4JE07_9STRA|mmetsp:Transcript_44092/g.134258  ORF Transcript_44092/g.134258 Transcript_44092/m.134258 type:complete len:937 (+) Transcript_44092:160-2970(+)